jgi:hypothetical protein
MRRNASVKQSRAYSIRRKCLKQVIAALHPPFALRGGLFCASILHRPSFRAARKNLPSVQESHLNLPFYALHVTGG